MAEAIGFQTKAAFRLTGCHKVDSKSLQTAVFSGTNTMTSTGNFDTDTINPGMRIVITASGTCGNTGSFIILTNPNDNSITVASGSFANGTDTLSCSWYIDFAYPETLAMGTGSAIVLKSGDEIPLKSDNLESKQLFDEDETLEGKAGALDRVKIAELGGGSIDCSGKYLGLGSLIAAVMGWEKPSNDDYPIYSESIGGVDSPITGTTDAGTTGTTLIDAAQNFTDNLIGEWVRIVEIGDATEGQVRRIIDVIGDDELTITPAWTSDPGAGKNYEIAGLFTHLYEISPKLADQLITEIYANYATDTSGALTDIIHRWGTYAVAKQVSNWEWVGIQVEQMSIKFSPAEGLMINFELVPFKLNLSNSQSLANIEYSAGVKYQRRILFADGIFRIGDYSASTALTDANKLNISEFNLTLKNGMKTDDRGTNSSYYRLEGERNQYTKITGNFIIPRYINDARFTKFGANTKQMAYLKCLGPKPIGGLSLEFTIYLGSLLLTKPAIPIDDPGLLMEQWDFEALIPAEAPAGFPTATSGVNPQLMIKTVDSNPFNAFRSQNKE